jgi:uncharacterized protein YndB with AHSA1/START domain
MSTALRIDFDPALDLMIERTLDVPPALVWRAWTEPEHLKQWFCPAPWSVSHAEIDLRPGGRFNTTMRSPEGEEHPSLGCFLEVVPGELLVFTDALSEGYRPVGAGFMTGAVQIDAEGSGTRYRWLAKHTDAEARQKHVDMGFNDGWATAADQMVAHIKAHLR